MIQSFAIEAEKARITVRNIIGILTSRCILTCVHTNILEKKTTCFTNFYEPGEFSCAVVYFGILFQIGLPLCLNMLIIVIPRPKFKFNDINV